MSIEDLPIGIGTHFSLLEENESFFLEYNKYERWFGGVFSMNKFENHLE